MSKLADKAKNSKLKESFQHDNAETKEKVLRQIKVIDYPRSYRLDPEIMNMLKSTLDRVNEVSPKKVSESRLIKALIFLSREINEEKIIKALKEVW